MGDRPPAAPLPERICDPHHHLWDLPGQHYATDELRADVATVPEVVRTVFVECGAWYRSEGPEHLKVVGETEWVAAHGPPPVEGIVGAVDLRGGDRAEEVLHAHIGAGRGLFRGVRQRVAWDASPLIRPSRPDPGPSLLLDERFRQGFSLLAPLGLSFDAWLYFPQLPELLDLARWFPETTIVLDHLGGPITLGPYADRATTLARWAELVTPLAACPNVVVKLGGIGMQMYGAGWAKQPAPPSAQEVAAVWRDPIRLCIDEFGPQRCMFESNFPVDKESVEYATLWHAFASIAADRSAADRAALFHDTAASTYRLDG